MRAALAGALLVLLAGCAQPAPAAPPTGPDAVRATRPAAVSGPARPGKVAAPAGATGWTRSTRPVTRVARAADHLVVPAVGIDAQVRPVRFAGSRLAIPSSIAEVGYWVDGARLGDAVGTTVLVGHVSDDHDRPGTLSRLSRVRVGAEIRVDPARGRTARFRVVRVRSYAKSALPRGVFAQTGPHRLVLITCSHRIDLPGGGFHYAQNLVVTARPVR
jgi:hypothetical protein